MEMLNQKQKIIAIIVIAIVVLVIGYYYINSTKEVYTGFDKENIVEEETKESEVSEKDKKIIIHITGAVKKNGIVEVEEKARIADVIEAAGGITEDANLTEVNLAYKVEDGQKIYIPSIDDKNNETTKKAEITSTEAGQGVIEESNKGNYHLVNINKATAAELMSIPGIGKATAARIIEYRQTVSKFKKIEDIKNVSGIGDAKFNTIKDFIAV